MRIFCDLRSIFPIPAGARKNTSNEQKRPLVLYAKPSNKRFIIPLQKNCYFAIGFYFLVRVFRNTLIPSVKMTLTMNKMLAGIICQTIEREGDYSTAKKKLLFWLLFSGKSVQNILILSVRMT